jgi:hypothetical protein
MKDPLTPPVTVLIKLGSIAVHTDEYTGPDGHPYDLTVIKGLLDDPEIKEWIELMDKMAFLPKKRK